jgi:hypothetical protein
MKCHECKEEMQMTPVCVQCGIIPIAKTSFLTIEGQRNRWRAIAHMAQRENALLRDELERASR